MDTARITEILTDPVTLDLVERQDRKSTRLNSSHSQISYAVFCLKKKRTQHHVKLPSILSTSLRPSYATDPLLAFTPRPSASYRYDRARPTTSPRSLIRDSSTCET